MMMSDDGKKKQATLIIASMSKKPKSESESSPEMGPEMESDVSGLEMAAEDIMAAIARKDAQALMHAMKAFHGMCMDEESESEPESESED